MDSKKSPGGTTLPTSAAEAAPPPPYEIKETRFATLSLHQTDRIRLLQFTPEEVDNIRSLVESAWADGIQAARDYGESSELKLKGTPWAGFKNDKQKPLLRTLFEGLYGMGWILDASISIAKTANAKDTFLFRKPAHGQPPPARDWLVISFDKYKILSIHGAPHDFTQVLKQAFAEWTEGTESFADEGRVELRLKHWYWTSHGEHTMVLRKMMLRIAEALAAFGFAIYASVRTVGSANTVAEQEADVLVCARERAVGNGQ